MAQGRGLGHHLAYFYLFCSLCHKGQQLGCHSGKQGSSASEIWGALDVTLREPVLGVCALCLGLPLILPLHSASGFSPDLCSFAAGSGR